MGHVYVAEPLAKDFVMKAPDKQLSILPIVLGIVGVMGILAWLLRDRCKILLPIGEGHVRAYMDPCRDEWVRLESWQLAPSSDEYRRCYPYASTSKITTHFIPQE